MTRSRKSVAPIWVLVISVLFGLALLTWWGGLVHKHGSYHRHPDGTWDTHTFHGAWGDAFGPVGALFSALTLGFAFWSLQEQREELDEQRTIIAAQLASLDTANRLTVMRMEFELQQMIFQEMRQDLREPKTNVQNVLRMKESEMREALAQAKTIIARATALSTRKT